MDMARHSEDIHNMKDKNRKRLNGSLIVIILLLLFFFLKGCEMIGCERTEDTDTTTTTHYTTTTYTTTTTEEPIYTCGNEDITQPECSGTCPEGQSCEIIVALFGDKCKCVDIELVR